MYGIGLDWCCAINARSTNVDKETIMTTSNTATAAKSAPAAKRTRKAPAAKVATTAELSAWRKRMEDASKAEQSAAGTVLAAVLEGRDLRGVTLDKYREECKLAFAHMEKRSAAKRVSDAMAILKAPVIPANLPGNLQHAAMAVRATDAYKRQFPSKGQGAKRPAGSVANGATVKKGTQAPKGDAPSADVAPLNVEGVKAALSGTLAGLRKRAADAEALALLDDLIETLNA